MSPTTAPPPAAEVWGLGGPRAPYVGRGELEEMMLRLRRVAEAAVAGRALPSSPSRPTERQRRSPGLRLAWLRRPGNVAFVAVLAVVVTGWWAVLRPTSFLGGPATFVVVHGTSMLPTLRTGDFVIAEAQPSYRVGDVVAYQVPRGQVGAGDDIIHRIVAGNSQSGFVLRGDNNAAPDPWTVPAADIRGKEVLHISGTGGWLLLLHSPLVLGAIAALFAMSLVLWPPAWLRRIAQRDEGGRAGQRSPFRSIQSMHGTGHPRPRPRSGSG